MKIRDYARLGSCHEKLKNFKNAAENWEEAQQWENAIHCYRQIPDLNSALRIAYDNYSPSLDTLLWLHRIRSEYRHRIEMEIVDGDVELTTAEIKLLREWTDASHHPGSRRPGSIQPDYVFPKSSPQPELSDDYEPPF
jgi:hypothetical protein